jgi:hypothetical protein
MTHAFANASLRDVRKIVGPKLENQLRALPPGGGAGERRRGGNDEEQQSRHLKRLDTRAVCLGPRHREK